MTRVINLAHIAWLRWCLAANEDYSRACEADGIIGTRSMLEWRKQANALRCKIAMLQS